MSANRKAIRLRCLGRQCDFVTAKAVVKDAEAYQHLLDLAAQADEAEGIRQGVEDFKKGRTRSAREALDEFRRVCAQKSALKAG